MTVLKVDGNAAGSGGSVPGNPPPRRRRWFWVLLAGSAAVLLGVGVVIAVTARPESRSSTSSPPSASASPSASPSASVPVPPPVDQAYANRCLAVGAAVNVPGRDEGPNLGLFRNAEQLIGPLTIRRSFDRVLPVSFAASSAAGDAAQGLHSFVSWKAPNGDYRGVAAGKYDQQVTAWAKSVPRTGVFATAYHEPENDMSAADFVALQRHLYPLVKAANPTIHWGPVYMAYWWDPTQTSHYVKDPAAWFPGTGFADFVGLDWYGPDPAPMTTSKSFQTWYHQFQPTGLPLVIPEYGQYFAPLHQIPDPAKLQARVDAIRNDAAWMAQHPEFKAWLYWEGGDTSGQWRLTDPGSQAAWQAIAGTGCRP